MLKTILIIFIGSWLLKTISLIPFSNAKINLKIDNWYKNKDFIIWATSLFKDFVIWLTSIIMVFITYNFLFPIQTDRQWQREDQKEKISQEQELAKSYNKGVNDSIYGAEQTYIFCKSQDYKKMTSKQRYAELKRINELRNTAFITLVNFVNEQYWLKQINHEKAMAVEPINLYNNQLFQAGYGVCEIPLKSPPELAKMSYIAKGLPA